MKSTIQEKTFLPTTHGNPVFGINTPEIRALTVGYIKKEPNIEVFVPGRLNMGFLRKKQSAQATVDTLSLPHIQAILKKYPQQKISTITLLRETLACQLDIALGTVGIQHYGDAYIGATHIKGDGDIRTAYLYENTEGLYPEGLWIVAESFCMGRNLAKTMESLLKKFHPSEVLMIAPLASRIGINNVDEIMVKANVPTTYIAWGALFGVDEVTKYDMPWGHKDTEPIDERDKKTFITMYSDKLCLGGDFGNNFYSPTQAKKLYDLQIKELGITPNIPSVEDVLHTYTREEIVTA